MAVRFFLDKQQMKTLLYYETGFEQLHPVPPVHDWMMQQGWEYYDDWNCVKVFNNVYYMEFRDDEMAVLFWLKWS
jgi:hypothetical protein